MKKRLFFSLGFFVKIALATILPLIIFALPGIVIDNKLESFPLFLIIGIVFSIITTIWLIRAISRKTIKKLES